MRRFENVLLVQHVYRHGCVSNLEDAEVAEEEKGVDGRLWTFAGSLF